MTGDMRDLTAREREKSFYKGCWLLQGAAIPTQPLNTKRIEGQSFQICKPVLKAKVQKTSKKRIAESSQHFRQNIKQCDKETPPHLH